MLQKQTTITASPIAVERAIDELRRQMGIVIVGENGDALAYYPVEFADEKTLSTLRSPSLRLLLTGARAKTLGLPGLDTQIAAQGLSSDEILALSNPLASLKTRPDIMPAPASASDSLALKLAKYASLLPALLMNAGSDATSAWLQVTAGDISRYIDAPLIDIVETASAQLPIEGAEHARIVSFRSRYSTAVHLALIIGDAASEPAPLTRIHSSCVTGDILGSLRCDCGDQLKLALRQISAAGSGLLIYLHQEGRGIGIANKLRAYQLQERGVDTYDANLMLGFEEDERDFSIAAAILKKLGVTTIRMLTNNPHKLAAMQKAGIGIAERLPLAAPPGKHNHGYLETKGKAGHWI